MSEPLLPDEFLNTLPDSPQVALACIFDRVVRLVSEFSGGLEEGLSVYGDDLPQVQAFAKYFGDQNGIELEPIDEDAILNGRNPVYIVWNWFQTWQSVIRSQANFATASQAAVTGIERAQIFMAKRQGTVAVYTFSDSSYSRIQELINELRTEVTTCSWITSEHRARLLKRLERLQQELHKTVSDTDRVWGFVAEMGVILGKFGNDAKPVVDRVKEIADIVWKTVSSVEKLQSGTPFKLTE